MPLTQPDILQSITNTVTVSDGAGSLTVDGAVAVSGTVAVTDNSGSLTVDNGGTFAVQAAQSGTWTVQPGNTANTTAWKVDGSAVTQPVSGTVTANAGSGPFPVSDNSGSLTVDAPVATPVFVRLSDGASAISTLPVSLATAPSTPVTNVGTFAVQSAQSGTWTVQPGNTANTTAWKVDASSVAVPITDNSGSVTVDAPVATPVFVRLSDGASAISTLPVSLASVPSHAVTNAGTFAVQAAQSGTWTVTPTVPSASSATVSSVAASATNVTLLASNANRKAVYLFNDGASLLYVKFGATASTTSFTIRVDAYGYWESGPIIYTGQIDGIWASASGSARITEV